MMARVYPNVFVFAHGCPCRSAGSTFHKPAPYREITYFRTWTLDDCESESDREGPVGKLLAFVTCICYIYPLARAFFLAADFAHFVRASFQFLLGFHRSNVAFLSR